MSETISAESCEGCGEKFKRGWGTPGAEPHQSVENFCAVCGDRELERLAVENQNRLSGMLLSTTGEIYGRNVIQHLGLVRGGTARAKNAVSDIGAGIKNIVGGEIKSYSQLLAHAREEAIQRMKEDAFSLGANAVVGVNFSTAMIDAGVAEIAAFGTAVILSEGDHSG